VIGNTIGNYRVTARLGEGGMGIVYLAEHPALGRKAAIKVLHPQMASDPQVVSRFFQEARASNAIRHPNIVDTYDVGTLPDGASYIIMELLEGESLQDRLKREGRLSVRAALDFACQAAGALAAAHEKGIVHRDLKPDNLFVSPDPRMPGHEQIKILDFGIAKLAGDFRSEVSHKTRTGTLMGTPLYMSPEQCLGVREVDRRSDIYALGCILYEMLCGAPPFVSEGFGALINMHINQPPVVPSRFNRDVRPAVEKAVLRMLAKSPEDRFPTMSEVRAVLQPMIADSPGTSRPGVTPPSGSSQVTLPAAGLSSTTLSASAISSPGVRAAIGAGTVAVWRRRRLVGSAVAAAGLVLGVAVFLAVRPGQHPTQSAAEPAPFARPAVLPPPAPAPAPTPAAPALAAAPTPAPPAPAPAAPTTVDVALASNPPGALVTADGVAIGTTPSTWKAPEGGAPVTFSFSLDGYKREVIKAVPAHGLRLSPSLSKAAARKPHSVPARPSPIPPPDDIKSER
jgi:serine/threonine-protein kinase